MSNPNKPGELDVVFAERISNWYGNPKHQPIVAALRDTGIIEAKQKPFNVSISADLAQANSGGKAFDPHAVFGGAKPEGRGGPGSA